MKPLRFLRRHALWLFVAAWLGSYCFFSWTGVYDRYERPATRILNFGAFDGVWKPTLLEVDAFQDWVDAPAFENLRSIPVRTFFYSPLLWLDWKFIHPKHLWPL